MEPDTPVVFLHGLLGDQGDWAAVCQWPCAAPRVALDLPGHGSNRHLRLPDFGAAHHWLGTELAARRIDHYRLVGYSLGGRLALYHASHEPPGLTALWVESGHPGLAASERESRCRHDERWALRFETEPLADVLRDWYRQPVFADLDADARQRRITRRLANDGAGIAAMLRATSLGQQPDLYPWLQRTTLPITWLCGRHDPKFHRLACQVAARNRTITLHVLDGGHDLHASHPQPYTRLLQAWVCNEYRETPHD